MIKRTNGMNCTQQFMNQYNELMMTTFCFSFDTWFQQDVWDGDYECYSIIEQGKMLANVSVYRMQLLMNGVRRRCLQLGAVAVSREHQGKGLSRTILSHILNCYPDTPAILFANDSVLDFYPKFGFVPVKETQPYIKCRLNSKIAMNKLSVDDPKVDRYLKERKQYSGVLDCENQYTVNWFHLLYTHSGNLYEIPELDVLMVAQHSGSTLEIFDIIAKGPVCFSQLMPYLGFDGVRNIHFGFNPDWLAIDYWLMTYRPVDTTYFVKGDLDPGKGYIVPLLTRT